MRINEVTAVYPDHPGLQRKRAAINWRQHFWQIVVRIEADSGEIGHGYGGGGVAAVEVVNRHFRELLVGRSVESTEDIAKIWDHLYAASLPYGRKGLAVMALSGVDLALWDLLGHVTGVPVCELLGGARKERVSAYATGPDTAWYRDLGFTAQKISHHWTGDPADYDRAEELVRRVREAMGRDARVMVDTYMSWDMSVTREMARRLADYRVYFFEDVLTPDHLEGQAELRVDVKPVLIAGGEHEFTHHGFAEIARLDALDVWQPDITWCGGITAGLRILEIAQQAGVLVVPHRGGEVWGLHLIAASDCEDFAELVLGASDHGRDDAGPMWIGSPVPEDGYITPTDRPGFGVSINEAYL